jgi:DNA invertase Pin-like site-specific DNA recombinase
MNVISYTRVSTDKQTTSNQQHEIINYSKHHNLKITEFIDVEVSSRRSVSEREITTLINKLNKSDVLIISELSRLGRSTLETLTIIDELKNKGVIIHVIKENMIIDPNKNDPMSELLLSVLSSVNQLERTYISERTKSGLNRVKSEGRQLGRKKGQQVKSKYDDHKDKIVTLLEKGLSVNSIVKIIEVGTQQSLSNYIKSRGLK